jgi:hypothetical protein
MSEAPDELEQTLRELAVGGDREVYLALADLYEERGFFVRSTLSRRQQAVWLPEPKPRSRTRRAKAPGRRKTR